MTLRMGYTTTMVTALVMKLEHPLGSPIFMTATETELATAPLKINERLRQ